MDVSNVSSGKPKVGGYAHIAAVGTTLPTDSTTNLAAAFSDVGYISESGVTNSNSPETSNTYDWGGTVVLSDETSKKDEWKFRLIECTNIYALKAVYGDNNVSGTLATGIAIKANNDPHKEHSWVFDMLLRDGGTSRVVLPKAKVTAIAEINYKPGEPVGYEITLSAYPDSSGDTHHHYMQAASE